MGEFGPLALARSEYVNGYGAGAAAPTLLGMGPTQGIVLAGPVEFSPVDIALILAVLALVALIVSAPGWAVVGYVMGRRPAAGASSGRRWRARVGGALLGIVLSAATAALVGALLDDLDQAVLIAVGAAWVACWGLAVLLHRSAPAASRPSAPAERPGEGWGR